MSTVARVAAWRGIFPALCTPFHADDRVDLEAQRGIVRFALEHGSHGLVVLRARRRGARLSAAEREELTGRDRRGDGRPGAGADRRRGREPAPDAAARACGRARGRGLRSSCRLRPACGCRLQTSSRYLADVASTVQLPVMVQDAGAYLGVSLSPEIVLTAAASRGQHLPRQGRGGADRDAALDLRARRSLPGRMAETAACTCSTACASARRGSSRAPRSSTCSCGSTTPTAPATTRPRPTASASCCRCSSSRCSIDRALHRVRQADPGVARRARHDARPRTGARAARATRRAARPPRVGARAAGQCLSLRRFRAARSASCRASSACASSSAVRLAAEIVSGRLGDRCEAFPPPRRSSSGSASAGRSPARRCRR